MLVFALLSSGARDKGYQIDSPEKKKKRDTARARAKGQVYKAEVMAAEKVDALPRKTELPIRSKKVIPWR